MPAAPRAVAAKYVLRAHSAKTFFCAVTRDGSTAVSTSNDGTARVWDCVRGVPRCVLTGHASWVSGCAISGDGRVAATASGDGKVRVWDVDTGRVLYAFGRPGLRYAHDCALSADGSVVVGSFYSGDVEQNVGEVVVCEWGRRGIVRVWSRSAHAYEVKVSDDCRVVAFSWYVEQGHYGIDAMDTGTGEMLRTWSTRGYSGLAMDSRGETIIKGDKKQLHVFSVAEGTSYRLPGYRRSAGSSSYCAITADGTVAVAAMRDSMYLVWNVRTGAVIASLEGMVDGVRGCAISENGTCVVSCSDDTVRVWNLLPDVSNDSAARESSPVSSAAQSSGVMPVPQMVQVPPVQQAQPVQPVQPGQQKADLGDDQWHVVASAPKWPPAAGPAEAVERDGVDSLELQSVSTTEVAEAVSAVEVVEVVESVPVDVGVSPRARDAMSPRVGNPGAINSSLVDVSKLTEANHVGNTIPLTAASAPARAITTEPKSLEDDAAASSQHMPVLERFTGRADELKLDTLSLVDVRAELKAALLADGPSDEVTDAQIDDVFLDVSEVGAVRVTQETFLAMHSVLRQDFLANRRSRMVEMWKKEFAEASAPQTSLPTISATVLIRNLHVQMTTGDATPLASKVVRQTLRQMSFGGDEVTEEEFLAVADHFLVG